MTYPERVQTVQPGAGLENVITVGGIRRAELVSVQVSLTTGLVLANRLLTIVITDQWDREVLTIPTAVVQVANTVRAYKFITAGEFYTVSGYVAARVPANTLMDPGWRISSLTENLQEGDQYSGMIVWLRRYDG